MLALIAYVVLWPVAVIGLAEVYARLLARTAALPPRSRAGVALVLLVALLLLAMAGLLLMPIGARWPEAWRAPPSLALGFVLAYLGGLVGALLFFRARHLQPLRQLGYFQPRPKRPKRQG